MIDIARHIKLQNMCCDFLTNALENGSDGQKINASILLDYINSQNEIMKEQAGRITGLNAQLTRLHKKENMETEIQNLRAILRTYGLNPEQELITHQQSARNHGAYNTIF